MLNNIIFRLLRESVQIDRSFYLANDTLQITVEFMLPAYPLFAGIMPEKVPDQDKDEDQVQSIGKEAKGKTEVRDEIIFTLNDISRGDIFRIAVQVS